MIVRKFRTAKVRIRNEKSGIRKKNLAFFPIFQLVVENAGFPGRISPEPLLITNNLFLKNIS
jgi:hypothetical protein